MTNTPNQNNDALDAARALREGISQFSEDIGVLKATSGRNRKVVRMLAVSVAFDILLSLGLGVVAFRADDASQKARTATSANAQAAQRDSAACVAINESNAGQLSLWQPLLLAPAVPQTDEQKRRSAEFGVQLEKIFAPRACTPPARKGS